MKSEYYVSLSIDGEKVESSAVAHGSKAHCDKVASRLNQKAHPRSKWVVLPCATNEIQNALFQ